MRSLLCLSAALAGCAPTSLSITTSAPRPLVAATPAALPSLTEIVEAAWPSVVLLLAYRPDGKVGYGAGVVVSATGHVLTSRHVIEGATTLRAMLHRPGRVSYTPMDGGLGRYLFENSADLVEVTVSDEDATTDLALVRVDADTSAISRPSFAPSIPRVGEEILVLGHPQEAVWSFTSGTVSGLPNGAIQHDAMVSQGSSGGPLLNRKGEIVGVSIAKVISESRGFAFARPIAMASSWVTSANEEMLDLSTPERAAKSCWYATELASPRLVECFDWDDQWSTYLEVKTELHRRLGGKLPPALARAIGRAKEEWVQTQKSNMIRWARTGLHCAAPETSGDAPGTDSTLAGERARVMAEIELHQSRLERSWAMKNGMQEPIKDTAALLRLLRRGLRVEEVATVRPDVAWVKIVGRNTDGTTIQFSEEWVKSGASWRQRTPPSHADRATLPAGWPPPLDDHELERQRLLFGLIDEMVRAGANLSG